MVQWLVQSWVEGVIFGHNEVLWSGLLKYVKGKISIKKASINHNERSREYDLIEIFKICVFIIAVLITRKKFFTILMFVISAIFALSHRSLFAQSVIKRKLCISIFDTVRLFSKEIAGKEIFQQIRCYLALPETPLTLSVSQVAKSIPN